MSDLQFPSYLCFPLDAWWWITSLVIEWAASIKQIMLRTLNRYLQLCQGHQSKPVHQTSYMFVLSKQTKGIFLPLRSKSSQPKLPNFFRPNFFDPKFFSDQTFFLQKFVSDTKFLWTLNPTREGGGANLAPPWHFCLLLRNACIC